jgi:hypothetical protein
MFELTQLPLPTPRLSCARTCHLRTEKFCISLKTARMRKFCISPEIGTCADAADQQAVSRKKMATLPHRSKDVSPAGLAETRGA